MSEQNNNNFVCNTNIDTHLTAKSDNFDQQKQIIIIEPDKKLEGEEECFLNYFGIFFELRKLKNKSKMCRVWMWMCFIEIKSVIKGIR